jgi:hypothetical protein
MRFLLIHYLDEGAALDPAEDPDAEGSAAAVAMRDWIAEMEGTGVKVSGGALRPSAEAATVRRRLGITRPSSSGTDRDARRVVLDAEEGMRPGTVEVRFVDRAVGAVGPVDPAAVDRDAARVVR